MATCPFLGLHTPPGLFLALVILLLVGSCQAQLLYGTPSAPLQVPAIQMWYNGYWKHVRLFS